MEPVSARVKTFRDLIAWQKAMVLAEACYRTTDEMPKSEQFGLTSQIRRAAVSIPSNIAEGHGRQTRADYLRFLRMARGSLMELQTQIMLGQRLRLLLKPEHLITQAEEVDRILQALIRGLERKAE